MNSYSQAVDIVKSGLQVGDKVPDVLIRNIINADDTTVRISNFKGKLLILDFWATWCAPCVAAIPHMNSLKKQYEGRVKFMLVTYQSKDEVSTFLQRMQTRKSYNFSTAVANTELAKLFPHRELPHYVWIDGRGYVQAITGLDQVRAIYIDQALAGQQTVVAQKQDLVRPYNNKQPMLFDNNGGSKSDLVYHAFFTRHIAGIGGGYSTQTDTVSGRKITARNQSITTLYKIAFSPQGYFGRNRTVFETKDTRPLDAVGSNLGDWLQEHTYCYELRVPFALKGDVYSIMRDDLRKLFPTYDAAVEKRAVKCLVLVRTSDNVKFSSLGGKSESMYSSLGARLRNQKLSNFTSRLSMIYLQRSPLPVIDGTNYTSGVDLDLEADFTDVKSINIALSRYELQFIEAEREIDMLIISNRK